MTHEILEIKLRDLIQTDNLIQYPHVRDMLKEVFTNRIFTQKFNTFKVYKSFCTSYHMFVVIWNRIFYLQMFLLTSGLNVKTETRGFQWSED